MEDAAGRQEAVSGCMARRESVRVADWQPAPQQLVTDGSVHTVEYGAEDTVKRDRQSFVMQRDQLCAALCCANEMCVASTSQSERSSSRWRVALQAASCSLAITETGRRTCQIVESVDASHAHACLIIEWFRGSGLDALGPATLSSGGWHRGAREQCFATHGVRTTKRSSKCLIPVQL